MRIILGVVISLTLCSVAWSGKCINWIDLGSGKQCIACEREEEKPDYTKLKEYPDVLEMCEKMIEEEKQEEEKTEDFLASFCICERGDDLGEFCKDVCDKPKLPEKLDVNKICCSGDFCGNWCKRHGDKINEIIEYLRESG